MDVDSTISYQSAGSHRPVWPRRALQAVIVAGLVLAICFWAAHLGDYTEYYGSFHSAGTPTMRLELPWVALAISVPQEGLHLRVYKTDEIRFRFDFWEHVEWPFNWYDQDWLHCNLLGCGFEIAPAMRGGHLGRDALVAVVLPYWLLILGLGWLALRILGIWKMLAPCRQWSAISCTGAVMLVLFFVLMNVVPNRVVVSGKTMKPDGIGDWLASVHIPPAEWKEMRLDNGFPLTCLRRGYVDGKPVEGFQNPFEMGWDSMGWTPHRAGEDLAMLALAIWLLKLGVGWVHMRQLRSVE